MPFKRLFRCQNTVSVAELQRFKVDQNPIQIHTRLINCHFSRVCSQPIWCHYPWKSLLPVQDEFPGNFSLTNRAIQLTKIAVSPNWNFKCITKHPVIAPKSPKFLRPRNSATKMIQVLFRHWSLVATESRERESARARKLQTGRVLLSLFADYGKSPRNIHFHFFRQTATSLSVLPAVSDIVQPSCLE